MKRTLRQLPVNILIALVRFYTFLISPLTGPSCRFYPTCSHYAHDALKRHGALKGLYLSCRRILRCQPWSGKGGLDPVPEEFNWRAASKPKTKSNIIKSQGLKPDA